MKRVCFVCLFLCLTTTFLLSQSNPVPLINQTTPSVVSPVSALQRRSVHAAAHQTTPAQTSGLSFAPAAVYGSGGYLAYSVAVADVNGDGKLDLVVANYCADINCNTNGSVGVLLGNGDGTFKMLAHTTPAAGRRWW